MNAGGWSRWSTRAVSAHERFDAWAMALQETHLAWALARPATRDVHAELTRATLGAARLVHCTCDPVSGERTRSEIAQTDEPWFGIVLVLEGAEQVAAGNTSLVLRPGQLAPWDSEQPLRFALDARCVHSMRGSTPRGCRYRASCSRRASSDAGAISYGAMART